MTVQARSHRILGRGGRSIVGLACAGLLAGGLTAVPVAAASAASGPPKVSEGKPAPVTPIVGRAHAHPLAPTIRRTLRPWPTAASGTASLPVGTGRVAVPGTPVVVANPTRGAKAARHVQVHVFDRGAGDAIGVRGLVLGLSTTTGASAPATISVDARGVADTFGGDWAARAHLVELTGCTVTGQKVSGCTGRRDLPTTSNGQGTLSATVSPAAAGTAPATGNSVGTATGSASPATATNASFRSASTSVRAASTLAAASSSGVTVLAATATAAGTAGSYAATPLSAASSWSAGGQSGSFSWTYPMTVPAVPGSLAPSVGIGYDSGSVDGRVATTNNQPSWVGDGFDLGAGFIERRYVACNDDKTGGNNASLSTGDLCWKSDNATLSMGGQSGPLVKDPADTTGATWKLYSDDGSKITRVGTKGAASGEYWVLTTRDGTKYTFGKGTPAVGSTATKSAWSVPVASNQPGEPNYDSSLSYAATIKPMVWRWNLDSVVDVHGNAINYVYVAETNQYGQNANHTVATYTRGGYLSEIDYGLRTDATSTPAAAKVKFTTAERCIPTSSFTCAASLLTKDNVLKWPDVPFDQICTAASGTVSAPATGGCVNVQSPAFFSRMRLTGVTTQVYRRAMTTPTWVDVDRYTINQSFRNPGDGTSDVLWPDSITHVGVNAANSATASAPTVTLYPTSSAMDNRVDKVGDIAPALARFRLASIDNGMGGQVSVSYSLPDCTPTSHPATTPDALVGNTRRCFPVYYTPPNGSDPVWNWFHKYVVTRVDASESTSQQPDVVTSYKYGTPAWHFDRDDLVPPAQRTWGQWRGYDTVDTFVGGLSGPWTAQETHYMQGMDGDCTNTACTTTRSATVSDSRGGSLTDADLEAGFVRESRTFNGASVTFDASQAVTGATMGTVVSGTLNTPWLSAASANDGTRAAKILRTATVNSRTYNAAGAVARETQSTSTFDAYGRATQVEDLGDDSTSVSGDDTCTRTTYPTNTTNWILDAPTSSETVGVKCATTPSRPGDILKASRTLYDGTTAANWTATPTLTKGDVTGVLSLSSWSGSAGVYTQVATNSYDVVGRAIDVADARGNHTTTTFTPTTAGPVTSMTTKNALSQSATTTFDIGLTNGAYAGRGLPVTVTDANTNVTTTSYDLLGRVTGVWLPGRATSLSANKTFTYTIGTATTPSKVASGQLRNDGSYTYTYAYYDGQLRPEETQTPSADGQGTRIVTQTEYDVHGQAAAVDGPSWAEGTAGSGLVTLANGKAPTFSYDNVVLRTETTYDGAGRVTKTAQRAGTSGTGWHTYTTTTTYNGTSTTVVPPAGGTPTTTITDADGNVTTRRQYTTTSGTAGAYQDTTYAYRPDGLLAKMLDAGGNAWTRSYDLQGRLVTGTDPDSGTTTTAYDATGNIATTKDARGTTLAYTYDALNRKTGQYLTSTSGTKLAAWTYDTVTGGKGLPATSTRYYNSMAYTRTITGYDAQSRATGASLTIPKDTTGLGSAISLALTYSTRTIYNLDGQIATYGEPAVPGQIAEGISYGYNALGQPITMNGGSGGSLVYGTTYSAYGQPLLVDEGGSPSEQLYITYGYQEGTRRLLNRKINQQIHTGAAADTTYAYDDAGNLTSIADKPTDTAVGTVAETQCFTYNPLKQLTSAWTPTSGNCATAPSASQLGGPAPYWTDWTYNTTGSRTGQTTHTTAGNTATTYTYPTPGTTQAHTLTKTTTTPPSGTATSTSYGYDTTGNTTTRTAGTSSTTYAWDEAGRLSGATTPKGSTSYLYDADGTRLIAKDPTGLTLYVDGGTEIRYTTATATITGTRTYTWLGQTIAVREGNYATYFTFTDPHNTGELLIDEDTQAVTTRHTNPFGQPRDGTTPTWRGDRGFVNGIQDTTTDLTQLGARPYDPTLGRFLAVDPLLNPDDPTSLNPYQYADDNPTTNTDADGLNCHSPESCNADYPYVPPSNNSGEMAARAQQDAKTYNYYSTYGDSAEDTHPADPARLASESLDGPNSHVDNQLWIHLTDADTADGSQWVPVPFEEPRRSDFVGPNAGARYEQQFVLFQQYRKNGKWASTSATWGMCISGGIGFMYYGGVSACWASVNGRSTLTFTTTGGGGSPTVGIGVGPIFSNATKDTQLGGWSATSGSSVGDGLIVGNESSLSSDSQGNPIVTNTTTGGIGINFPVPFEYHGGVGHTWEWTP